MNIVAITTKTSRHTSNLKEVYDDLVKSKTPFNVQLDFNGQEFPVPFDNGKATNYKIEYSVREVLTRTFGIVHYLYKQF